jgi:hypothetical protein
VDREIALPYGKGETRFGSGGLARKQECAGREGVTRRAAGWESVALVMGMPASYLLTSVMERANYSGIAIRR